MSTAPSSVAEAILGRAPGLAFPALLRLTTAKSNALRQCEAQLERAPEPELAARAREYARLQRGLRAAVRDHRP